VLNTSSLSNLTPIANEKRASVLQLISALAGNRNPSIIAAPPPLCRRACLQSITEVSLSPAFLLLASSASFTLNAEAPWP
jgi:hypothetical protein